MSADLGLDLSGLHVGIRGAGSAIEDRFRNLWAPYVTRDLRPSRLRVEVETGGDRFTGTAISTKRMESRFGENDARFTMEEGTAQVDSEGNVSVTLAPATDEVRFFALVNLLLAVLAWHEPRRGGLVLHAAGVVYRSGAFLLVGSENAGKTTWAELFAVAGGTILSDDVVFVDLSGETVLARATPFREYGGQPCGPGTWPVAAILLPVHGTEPALRDVPAILRRARIAANLPFVNERVGSDAGMDSAVDRLVGSVPFHALTFARNTSFVPLLEPFAGGGDDGTS